MGVVKLDLEKKLRIGLLSPKGREYLAGLLDKHSKLVYSRGDYKNKSYYDFSDYSRYSHDDAMPYRWAAQAVKSGDLKKIEAYGQYIFDDMIDEAYKVANNK